MPWLHWRAGQAAPGRLLSHSFLPPPFSLSLSASPLNTPCARFSVPQRDGAEGYILDLRNNPGGLVTSSLDIASLWLDGGRHPTIFNVEVG